MAVLSFQSAVAYGHVGNSAAVFPLQCLGHEVWPIDTVSFSNHPAHGGWRGRIRPAAELTELVTGIAERGALAGCDAVLSGYLGESATAPVVLDAVRRVKAANPGALYCCDPVIGEVGRGVYVGPGIAEAIRDTLVAAADLVTPNPFELAFLTGRPVDTIPDALLAVDALRRRGPGLVVATGLAWPGAPAHLAALAVDEAGAWMTRAPRRRVPGHGAGDCFTALFLGVYLGGRDPARALGHAVAALDAILAVTESTGAGDIALIAARDAITRPPAHPPVERLR